MTRWQLVPVKPSLGMRQAALDELSGPTDFAPKAQTWDALRAYTAMLSAAPAPDDAVVERVARAMAPVCWLPFDHKLHGSPVNRDQAQRAWLGKARAAIAALLGEQG